MLYCIIYSLFCGFIILKFTELIKKNIYMKFNYISKLQQYTFLVKKNNEIKGIIINKMQSCYNCIKIVDYQKYNT